MTRAHLVALALVVASACGQKQVHRPGEEWLDAIKFEGNAAIDNDDLRDGLALRRVQKRGGSPDPYLVVVDGKRIEGEYIRRGYLEVDVRSRVERHGDRTTVTYTIHEGPRAKTRVLITGIPKDDPDLTVATKLAIQEMIDFLVAARGLTKHQAYQLTSIAGHVSITQLVDLPNLGVHVKMSKEIFRK